MSFITKAIDLFMPEVQAPEPSYWQVFDPTSEVGMMLYSALGGAVLGAVIGGAIQFGLSSIEHGRTVKREKEEQRGREKAIAFRAMVISTRFNNRLFSIISSMTEQLDEAKDNFGPKGPVLWQRLYYLSGIDPEHLHFAVEDVALILKMKEDDLGNDMLLLAERYASTISSVIEFHKTRAAMKDRMPMDVKERLASTILTHEELIALSPYFQELSDLATQCCDGLIEEFELAQTVDNRLKAAIDKYFGNEARKINAEAEARITDAIYRFKDLVGEVRQIKGDGFTMAQPEDRPRFWVPTYEEQHLGIGPYILGPRPEAE